MIAIFGRLVKRSSSALNVGRFSTHSQSRLWTSTFNIDPKKTFPFKRDGVYLPRLGHIVNSRYKIIDKLAQGRHATIWLAYDSHNHSNPYVSLRVCANSEDCMSNQARQVQAHKHLSEQPSKLYGRTFVERCHDLFEIEELTGKFQCLVQPLMGGNMWEFIDDWGRGRAVSNAKIIFKAIFEGLDYLHSEANIVHTDLRFETITFQLDDTSSAQRAKEIFDNPAAHPKFAWKLDNTITAKCDNTYALFMHDCGNAIISDFGEARIGQSFSWTEYVQPNIMRAPEVELRMNWDSKVDIWNAACLMWAEIESRYLFDDVDPSKLEWRLGPDGNFPDSGHCYRDLNEHIEGYNVLQQIDPLKYLSNIVSVIGLPPKKFLDRAGPYARQYFDENGCWLHHATHPINGHSSLATLSTAIQKRAGRDEFLDLMAKCLSWLPEDRPSAGELTRHPFFRGRDI